MVIIRLHLVVVRLHMVFAGVHVRIMNCPLVVTTLGLVNVFTISIGGMVN